MLSQEEMEALELMSTDRIAQRKKAKVVIQTQGALDVSGMGSVISWGYREG